MTAPVSGTSTGNNTNSASTVPAQPILGKDDFLQMLVAQLQNQDPMNPMDGTAMAAELAQFSTVEQLTELNSSVSAQTSASAQEMLAQQASFGNSLIGRDVITSGANVTVVDGQNSRVNVDLDSAAANVHVDVIGADGKTVIGSQNYTNLPTGSNTLTIDTSKLAAGSYTYNVTASDTHGGAVNASGFSIGTVQGTLFQNGQVMLRVNGAAVPITDIVEVVAGSSDSGSTSTTH